MDIAILRELVADGRATLQTIADRVGLRRPSVHARVRALEERGVLRGYHAALEPDAVGGGLVAFAYLQVCHGRGQDCFGSAAKVAEALRRVPQVLEVHTTAGDDDMVVKLRARDIRELEHVVLKQVSGIAGVERVRTSIALSTHFERPLQVALPSTPARRRRS